MEGADVRFMHELVFTKRTSAALLCLNNLFLSTVVRKVRVVKTGLLSHCFLWRLSLLTSISLALDQLLSDFFCSMISTQSAFGFIMDFGLFSE